MFLKNDYFHTVLNETPFRFVGLLLAGLLCYGLYYVNVIITISNNHEIINNKT